MKLVENPRPGPTKEFLGNPGQPNFPGIRLKGTLGLAGNSRGPVLAFLFGPHKVLPIPSFARKPQERDQGPG